MIRAQRCRRQKSMPMRFSGDFAKPWSQRKSSQYRGPPLAPKRSSKRAAVRFVARAHVALQVMTRNQFVKYGGPREMNVVAAHAHHLLLVAHSIGRVRNADCLAAREEWIYELSFRRHHLHAPTLARERRHCHEVVLFSYSIA